VPKTFCVNKYDTNFNISDLSPALVNLGINATNISRQKNTKNTDTSLVTFEAIDNISTSKIKNIKILTKNYDIREYIDKKI